MRPNIPELMRTDPVTQTVLLMVLDSMELNQIIVMSDVTSEIIADMYD